MNKGHKVHLIAQNITDFNNRYHSFSFASSVSHFYDAVEAMEDSTDIFHVHNEPNWLGTIVKEVSNKPLVFDVHDTYLVRATDEEIEVLAGKGKTDSRYYVDERNNFELADGLNFVSKTMADVTRREYGLEQPYSILHSFAPKEFTTLEGVEHWGGLVYEGKVDLKEKLYHHGFRYCQYEDFAEHAKGLGLGFHLYGPKGEDYEKAFGENAFLHGRKSYGELLACLARHDWGLVGNLEHTPHWDATMPNKIFDYMMAGVPTVAMNAVESGNFVTEHGIGILVSSIEELMERWDECRDCRRNLIKKRRQFVMEAHIHKLEELYMKITAPQ
jgi:hypothetical protein